jgi:hypothetical protein
MTDDITEETWKVAKEELGAAIKKFYATVEPEMFVDDWVLVVHKDSIELAKANQSIVSVTVPYGQAFHRTTGLLVHATKGD